jgi:putative transposase
MVPESIVPSNIYTRKIRVYGDDEFRKFGQMAFGSHRLVQNHIIAWIRDTEKRNTIYDETTDKWSRVETPEKIEYTNPVFFRERCFLSNEDLMKDENEKHRWMMGVPYDTRELAVRQLCSNFKTAFTQLGNKTIKKFYMKFRSSKNPTQIAFFNKKAFNFDTLRLCPRKLKTPLSLKRKRNIKRYKREINTSMKDCNLILMRQRDHYYLCIPQYHDREKSNLLKEENKKRRIANSLLSQEEKDENKKKYRDKMKSINRDQKKTMNQIDVIIKQFPHNIVALDPGIVTFMTYYSDQDMAGKLGDKLSFELLRLFARKEDTLKSLIDLRCKREAIGKARRRDRKSKLSKTIRNMKKRCFLLRTKIRNIVDDLHWKSIRFLTTNFKHILLPSFEVKSMTSRKIPGKIRALNSPTTRRFLTLCHNKFKERLKYACGVNGNSLYIVDEAYTSKTCGACGKEKKCKRWFKCGDQLCGFQLDRDYNGARNIFLKHVYWAGSSPLSFS